MILIYEMTIYICFSVLYYQKFPHKHLNLKAQQETKANNSPQNNAKFFCVTVMYHKSSYHEEFSTDVKLLHRKGFPYNYILSAGEAAGLNPVI